MFSKNNNITNNDNNYNNNLKDMNYIGNIFDEQNKNINNIRYYDNMRNYNNDDCISFAKTDRFQDNNNNFISENKSYQKNTNKKLIYLNGLNINISNNKYNHKNKINSNKFDGDSNNQSKEIINSNKKNTIIDKVNQLRMVFNLLEQHENNNNNLYNCFNKWLYETKIKQRNINNKVLFWSFSGNNNLNINNKEIGEDNNKKEYNKYSINTYKGKDMNYNYSGNKNFADMGKYTPIRGIKNFRSKTSQKMSNNQNIFDINDIDINGINKNLNLNIFNNEFSSLTNNNYYMNKVAMNMVFHKKKLITPNIQQNNYNNYFLEFNNNINNNIANNNSYNITNFQNYNLMNLTNINNSITSFHQDNYYINQYKSSNYIQSNLIQAKKIDLKRINRIEEKEINFALYKRNNSYNNSLNINNNNNINNRENIKIIYRKVQNGFINNNNKKYCIYSNNIKNLKNKLKHNVKPINYSFENLRVKYGKIINLENDIKNYNEKEKNKVNFSFSFFENKYTL